MEAVQQSLTLATSCSEFNPVVIRSQLAMLYGVPVELIEVSNPCSHRRRALVASASLPRWTQAVPAAGTTSVVVTIRDPSGSADIDALVAALEGVSDAALTSALGVSTISMPVQRTAVTMEVQAACPPGSFSKVGECALCRPGSFSSAPGNSNCTDCATGTYQASSGATQCDICGAGN